MAAITVQHVSKSYDGQLVLGDVSLSLHKGEKVGLVGANGSGKTTLFRLMVGAESPDLGDVSVGRGIRLAYLPQTPSMDEELSLLDVLRGVFDDLRALEAELGRLADEIAEAHGTPQEAALLDKYDRQRAKFEAAGGYGYEIRLREVLGGLGFEPDQYQLPVRLLSGGQKCRAALGRVLLEDADMLLLDEPTNHLDIDATRWLEKFLAAYRGGAVIISHDRFLLDRVVSKIIEVENHRITVYPTNYTHYAEAKRIRQLQAAREYQQQREWLAHQRDYIDRARYRKDTAKQARGRQKYIDRMEADGKVLDKPQHASAKMSLNFKQEQRGGDMVIRCERASKGFGDVQLIRDLDFEMTRGEKVGIIGPNGVGKTTLLRMLLRQLEPDAGTVRLFENLSVGYYDQEHRDLNLDQTVLEAVRAGRPEVKEQEARSFLALFLFRGDDVFKRVGDLSGGEQSRVLLARLVWSYPQVLVLDEPTNHLDIPAREALEEAMRLFPGSVLMVSHDRYFLDQVVDRLLVLPRRGEWELVAGNWTTYSDLLDRRESDRRAVEQREKQEQQANQPRGGKAKAGKSRSKYAAKRIEDLEERIIRHEARQAELETAFADPGLMKDAERSRELHVEYTALQEELKGLNQQWEDAIDRHAG